MTGGREGERRRESGGMVARSEVGGQVGCEVRE
jgi:hypothetical protein